MWAAHLQREDLPEKARSAMEAVLAQLPSAERLVPDLTVHPGRRHPDRSSVQMAEPAGTPVPRTPRWHRAVEAHATNNINNWAGGSLNCPSMKFTMPTNSPLDAYTTPGQQHVHYLAADGHVHELFYDGIVWHNRDLTVIAAAPVASPTSGLAGWTTSDSDRQHIAYVGADALVHQLLWDSAGWRNDVPGAAGKVAVRPGSRLAAYTTADPDQEHIVYIGPDGHVHQLTYDDGAWHPDDLSKAAAAPKDPRVNSPLIAFSSVDPDQQHVYYIGTDHWVYELVYDGGVWTPHNVNSDAGSKEQTAPDSALAGYRSTDPAQLHVVFQDDNNHVQELLYDGGWRPKDLTKDAPGAPTALRGGSLAGFTSSGQQHVLFLGTDMHVHQLLYDGGWREEDLTGPTPVVPDTHLCGYPTSDPDQQHVLHVGTDQHLHELYYDDGAWHDKDLTPLALTPWTSALGSWRVPSVAEPDYAAGAGGGWHSSSWVGIDGAGTSNDVLQAGVEQQVDDDGTAKYFAWYEWYAPEVDDSPPYRDEVEITNMPVQPGDLMFCSVQYLDYQAGSIFLMNQTRGVYATLTLAPPHGADFRGDTAEWIMETPEIGDVNAALPAFAEVVFDPAFCVDGNDTPGNPQTGTPWTIILGDPAVPGSPALTSTTLGPQKVTIDYLPWHGTNLTAATASPKPAAGPICGYASGAPDQLHVDVVDLNGHVRELAWDGGIWSPHDLTVDSGDPGHAVARPGSLAGWVSSDPQQQHVAYLGTDGHVHELSYDDGTWHPLDLTQKAGLVPPIAATSPVVGFASTQPSQQHVYVVGVDSAIHELVYDQQWAQVNLMIAAPKAVPVGPQAQLAGCTTPGQLHVYYVGTDNHVHELVYSGGTWTPHDLTIDGQATLPAASTSRIYAYATDQQHVIYLGSDGHVHELVYSAGDWSDQDLSLDAGWPLAVRPMTAVTGYASTAPDQLHVNAVGVDQHLHEYVYDGGIWHHVDLTTASATPDPQERSIAAFTSGGGGQQHVVFIGNDGNVWELYY
jgi:hypothetical protein